MSYDLYFTSDDVGVLTRERFEAYFTGRDCYTIRQSDAFYENPDTGIYFFFSYNAASDGEDAPAGESVSFDLNYGRPHVFALEAEPEVSAFVRALGLNIEDPQLQGMANGPYSREGFLRGWNTGNQYGYSVFLKDSGDFGRWSLPTAELERVWRWNFAKEALYKEIALDAFIPMILYAQRNGRLCTAVVWSDAIPTFLPQVDCVIIFRQDLQPRRWFKKSAENEKIILDYQSAVSHLTDYDQRDINGYSCYVPRSPVPSNSVQQWFRGLASSLGEFSLTPTESVLNSELISAGIDEKH